MDLQPAGASYSAHHHGHVIVPQRILIGVLAILLFFTLLTVAAAKAEVWFAHAFDVVIPQWVNVAVALSIAAVKSVIVALYFMQLRYDNPVNGIVVIFTLMVLAFFLGFTSIDLGSRDTLYAYKAQLVVPGGTGDGVPNPNSPRDKDGKRALLPAGVSITAAARARADTIIDEALASGRDIEDKAASKFEHHRQEEILELTNEGKPLPADLAAHVKKLLDGAAALHKAGKPIPAWVHHFEDAYAKAAPLSTADRARVRRGITMPGLAPAAGHGDDHGDDGAGHKAPEKAPTPPPAPAKGGA